MSTFADKAVNFHRDLYLDSGKLPQDIKVLNPFAENSDILPVLETFFHTFFEDNHTRTPILGINPGRLGAGATGVAFTDTKRLKKDCGIEIAGFDSHEPSSVFVYEVIRAFGGAQRFYNQFYIDSVCPLGFVRKNKKNNWVNCNYYDLKSLYRAVKPFILSTLEQQIAMGLDTSVCFVLGKKNARFLECLNAEGPFFKKIVALPHPRYIIQYRRKEKSHFIADYLGAFKQID